MQTVWVGDADSKRLTFNIRQKKNVIRNFFKPRLHVNNFSFYTYWKQNVNF